MIFNQDGHGSQDEGQEEVEVDVVPGAVELPVTQMFKNYQQNKQIWNWTKTIFFLILFPLKKKKNPKQQNLLMNSVLPEQTEDGTSCDEGDQRQTVTQSVEGLDQHVEDELQPHREEEVDHCEPVTKVTFIDHCLN